MPEPEVNLVKGVAVVATLRFLKERFGDEALRSLLAELEPADRAALEAALVSAWYPLPALLRLMRAAHRRFGAQMPGMFREMGRASADYGFNTVYRIFFKLGSPQLDRAHARAVRRQAEPGRARSLRAPWRPRVPVRRDVDVGRESRRWTQRRPGGTI